MRLIVLRMKIDATIELIAINTRIALLTVKLFLFRPQFRELMWIRIKLRYLDWKIDLDYVIQSRITGIPVEDLKRMQ